MRRRVSLLLGIAVIAVLAVSIADIYGTLSFRLNPAGLTRVSLSSGGTGAASWNNFIQVMDGSFAAQLDAGTGAGDSASVTLSPLHVPLSRLAALAPGGTAVNFWAYFQNNRLVTPTVDMVLDNGRRMEGDAMFLDASQPVSGTVDCATDDPTQGAGNTCRGGVGPGTGYEGSDLWILMKPRNDWYSSFAGVDPCFTIGAFPGTLCPLGWTATGNNPDISHPATLAQWSAQFPGAQVVQLRITYYNPAVPFTNPVVYIDDVIFAGALLRVEPETASVG
jgi:hypothetical protein